MNKGIQTDEWLSLSEAARAIPLIDGHRPHISTMWRWCRKGVRGVRLEYARLGRRIVTSKEALAAFAKRLAEADAVEHDLETPIQEKGDKDRDQPVKVERATDYLRSVGIIQK